MRILFLLPLLISFSAHAGDLSFTCSTPADATTNSDMSIELTVNGNIQKKGDRLELSYGADFALGCDDDWSDGDVCWAQSFGKYGRVLSNAKYNPRKYKNHSKFELNLDSKHTYGQFDFIFPKDEIRQGKKEFSAYMIMTYINDHFGDTAQLDCKVTAKFEMPDNYVDIKECKEQVQALASVVNICGNDQNFTVHHCKQESLGEKIQCAAASNTENSQCTVRVMMNPTCTKNISSEILHDTREGL